MMGITDPYVAYCLDEAVAVFGNTISDELAGITDKNPKRVAGKQERHLAKRLGIAPKFADPAVRGKK